MNTPYSDLLERLHGGAFLAPDVNEAVFLEAAAEIERLRAEVARVPQWMGTLCDGAKARGWNVTGITVDASHDGIASLYPVGADVCASTETEFKP